MSESSRVNCEQFALLAYDFARWQEIDAMTRRAVELHVRSCAACAVRLRAADLLTVALRELATSSRTEQASLRVEAILLAAFRKRSQARIASRFRPRRLPPSWASVAAAAALVFALLAIGRLNWLPLRGHRSPSRQIETRQERLTGSALPQTGSPAGADRARDTSGVPPESERAASTGEDRASDFFPLQFGEGSPLGDAQLVRVRLSGAALLALGLDVDEERAQEFFLADVLLAEDGQARGIRIVTQ